MRFLLYLLYYGIPVGIAFGACRIFDMELPGWLATFGVVLFGMGGGIRKWNKDKREYEQEGGSCLDMFIGFACIVAAFIIVRFF